MNNELIVNLTVRLDTARQEIARLRTALKEAESIRDDLVSLADQIGETIFMDYAEVDPTGNGNERYDWTATTGLYLFPIHLKKIAGLINEALDSDWVQVSEAAKVTP